MARSNRRKSAPQMPTRAEFDLIVKSANEGSETDLARLRDLLDNFQELWQAVGDLGRHAEAAFIAAAANGNHLLSESLGRKAQQLRDDLLGPEPSRIETLAVQRIVACTLEVEFFDSAFPASANQNAAQARLAEKLKTSAQRRLDAAMKSFCLVKKLPLNSEGGRKGVRKLRIVRPA